MKNELETLPDGDFFCTNNGNYYKWFQSNECGQTYIPKTCRPLAEQLAHKKYISLKYNDLLHEKQALDSYLKHHVPYDKQASLKIASMPAYQELLSPSFLPISSELLNWANSPYESNTKYPEQLVQKTCTGTLVRSKSEAMIHMILSTNQIPFRYECALTLGDSTIFPDFTIRHPHTGALYYWEHFGLMDVPNYYHNTYSKLQLYTSYGIIPSIQLITTFETKDHPLSVEAIETLVTYFFL